MSDNRFVKALNEQIAYEFGASQQYAAVAVHYDAETLPRLAAHFYRQALEERNHAMMMVQYLLDAGEDVVIPGVEAPRTDVRRHGRAGRAGARAGAARHRARSTPSQRLAREHGDYAGEQFMQWFIKEQVEEVSSMSDLLRVVERARENPLLAEEYLAREGGAEAADPTAPHAAGGAL